MIHAKLTIPPEVEDLLDGLTDADMEELLFDAAEGYCGPGGVLEQHFLHGQSGWGDPHDQYRDWKRRKTGGDEKFVKTGTAKEALTGKSPYRVIQTSRKGGKYVVEVALVRMEGGRNVYSIAQAGGKNNAGPPMRITQALPGDDEIVAPYVESSLKKLLKGKGAL